ncbi:PDDEXK family nuclease [Corynebacterium sanguinis]|uniref:VRR-NUC domain-containing protein n=1 Tax=Corynebacterium sanguinis TaxID=2594913 RepID=A0A6C1TZ05_9CORY|nr:VRR-NUC domain-containing protein [Corynebacterium sanguinis]TVS29813.1 VRR-NUC domain-containing protein [Corynebacterium sanguinis]
MLEKAIEKTLKTHVEKAGGMCLKLHPDSMVGLPDRLILLPGGKTAFVELKQAGQKPRPIQTRRHEQLTALGHQVRTLDNTHDIPGLIHEIRST